MEIKAVILFLLATAVASKNVSDDRQVRRIVEAEPGKSAKPSRAEESARGANGGTNHKWVTQLFLEAEQRFELHPDASARCRQDYELYKAHLSNQSVWAVRMMESTEWPSVGVFAGTVDHFGNFDECLLISSHGINGQYCLAHATYNIIDRSIIRDEISLKEKVHPDISVWNAMEMYRKNPVRVDRHKLSWALCLPSSCKNEDLSMSLNRTLQPIFKKHGLNITVDIEPKFCHVKEKPKLPPGYYYTTGFLGLLFSLAIIGSIYDVATRKNLKEGKRETNATKILKCFSAVSNFKKLIHVSLENDYILVHFSKVLNILMVIYGHRFIYFIGYPKFNSDSVEDLYRASSIELIHTNVVDVFFCISGFLTFHFGFLPMLKGGGLFFILNITFRWIRMVPVFMLLLLIIVNVLPYMGDGPLWNHRILGEAARCESSWISNLLVVNNIVSPEKQCLVISWYISTDIQLTILGTILLFAITRHKTFGTFLAVLAFIGVTAITFAVAYINNFHGLLLLYIGLLEEPRNADEFNYFYIAPYSRAGPYLLGFLSAYIVKLLKERNYVFSIKQMVLITAGSIIIGEGSQFYGCNFYVFGREYNRLENSIYAALNRTLFALPYAAMSIVYFTSGLGLLQRLLDREIFVPLGRLTYSVFLVNTIIQLFHASNQKTVMPSSSRMNLYWWAVTDIIFSYIAGLILHLLAEAPISNMSKLLQKFIISLFIKKSDGNERTEKTDSGSGDDKSTQCSSKSSSPELNAGKNYQNGYQNHSFVNNECVPKVSEDSRI